MSLLNKLFFFGSKKRKVILINPKFQLSVINYVILLFTFVMIAFYLVNLFFIYILKQKGIDAGLPLNSEYFHFLQSAFHLMSIFYLFTSLVILIIIYFFGLRFSNRIAGPIYRMNKVIAEIIKEGKPIEVKLRKNDYFQDHADAINSLINYKLPDNGRDKS